MFAQAWGNPVSSILLPGTRFSISYRYCSCLLVYACGLSPCVCIAMVHFVGLWCPV